MSRLMLHLAFVIGATLGGGLLGGVVGREVGRQSPSFVTGLAGADSPMHPLPADFRPAEFGLGLGAICGLFFGAGAGLVLVVVATLRDAWQARLDLVKLMRTGAHAGP